MNKHDCITKAKSLIASGDEASLRYASLELRMCMELITYEKLRTYSSMIPEAVLEKWQPPQAVKALLEFEPHADKNYVLSYGRQKGLGMPAETMTVLGEHTSLSYKWLRTHYNKIGNALHAQAKPNISPSGANRKDYLEEVISDLEKVLASRINGSGMRNVFSVECERCNDQVVVNTKSAKKTGRALCFKPGCGAEYTVKISDDEKKCEFLLIQSEFTCDACEKPIYLPTGELSIGRNFTCRSCNAKHKIVNMEWVYEVETEGTNNAVDPKNSSLSAT
jgi:hypothetical protein